MMIMVHDGDVDDDDDDDGDELAGRQAATETDRQTDRPPRGASWCRVVPALKIEAYS